MDTSLMIKQQKSEIVLHRIIYFVFILVRIFLHIQNDVVEVKDNHIIILFAIICLVLEEIFCHKDYFNSIKVLRCFRYGQTLLIMMMLFFTKADETSIISVVALLLMFVVDLFLTLNIMDITGLISFFLSVVIPIFVVLLFKITTMDLDIWVTLLLEISLVIFVLFYGARTLISYVDSIEKKLFDQQNEISDMRKRNEEIVEMQNKLQDTNYILNTQKNDLKNANEQIREANEQMSVQTDVLHYIAMSFDVTSISQQIVDSIMKVKKLDFCGVYIVENAYRNKSPNCVIHSVDEEVKCVLTEDISDIYHKMLESGKKEIVLHEEIRELYPKCRNWNLKTVYIKVLELENDAYGLFMIGDRREKLFDEKMSFYEAIIAQYDIAISNARIYNDMQYMAQKDGLTGINNRLHFKELFTKETKRIVEENGCISVALLDIDKFKSVNDTYGHLAGDEVIKRIASVTEECIQPYSGFVCRYGGEEFVAVLPDYDLNKAQPVIERMFDALCSQVVHFNDYDIHMSVSVGLTSYPEVCKDTEELLKRADWCMYYAKEHGRHQIKIDDGSIQRD